MITPTTQDFPGFKIQRESFGVSALFQADTELEFIFDVSTTQFPYKLFCVFHGKIQENYYFRLHNTKTTNNQ